MINTIDKISNIDKSEIGGKAHSLNKLMTSGVNVPNGIIVPSSYFINCLEENKVIDRIILLSQSVDYSNASSLCEELQSIVLSCEISIKSINELALCIQKLNDFVSVRSSAASEDGELNTFAGLHDTFLNIQNNPINIIEAIKKCWASLFNERALLYRIKKELPIFEGMAVVVQNMIQAECSGVVYTKHPIENKYILVESAFGIGDTVVDGKIKPDSFLIERDTLNVANSELGRKYSKTQIENGIHTVNINEDTETFSIHENVLKDLVVMCLRIEQIFGKTQDIEWAYDGTLWFLQSRTVNF